jgi:hypothetical protein
MTGLDPEAGGRLSCFRRIIRIACCKPKAAKAVAKPKKTPSKAKK